VIHDKVEEKIIIFLERSSPFFGPAQDFLVVIAEPCSRPKYVNEYKLTAISLYAAASIGLSYNNIIETLAKFCKTEVPESVNDFIHSCTSTWGKVTCNAAPCPFHPRVACRLYHSSDCISHTL
jgi:DNA excision repair protein ERCC-3